MNKEELRQAIFEICKKHSPTCIDNGICVFYDAGKEGKCEGRCLGTR
jgi:hypothetical protein